MSSRASKWTIRTKAALAMGAALLYSCSVFGQTKTTRIWNDSVVPATIDGGDTSVVELGMRFRSQLAGSISGLAFYKSPLNSGTHIGNLWSGSGTLMATVTFTNETASGWQTANFATPVPIAANTTYVISYHTDAGHFSFSTNFFVATDGGVFGDPLLGLASGVDGMNGVYAEGQSSFPNSSYLLRNYFVDPIFSVTDTGATTLAPSSVTLVTGTLNGGTVTGLTTDENTTYRVNSTTSSTRTATWYGSFLNVPNDTPKLSVAYKGKNSRSCTEIVSVYNWVTLAWVNLDSRAVSTTEVLRYGLTPTGTAGDFVSGTSGPGEVRVRVSCTTTANFNTAADLLSLTYDASGARMTFTYPASGTAVPGTSFTATYVNSGNLAAAGVNHAHLYLDSNPVVMDIPMDGAYLFSDVPAGSHTLRGILAKADHSEIAGTDSSVISFVTTAPDQELPTVSMTAPAEGTSVLGTVTVSATAGDNIGVAGVQFLLDGNTLGVEDTTSPYSISWDSGLFPAGPHVLTARARDTSGNIGLSAARNITVLNPLDPATVGQWSAVKTWPSVAVHSILLYTGKVLVFEGLGLDGQGRPGGVWDPATGAFKQILDPASDIFCAGHVVLPDGRVLVVGGHSSGSHIGIQDVNIFNPATETWSAAPPMAFRRWYPTATVLPDGRVLVTSGADVTDRDYVAVPEIYNPVTNSWSTLTAASKIVPAYGHVFVLEDGSLAYTGSDEAKTGAFKLNVSTQTWSTVDATTVDGGTSVMYDYGKFMKSGTSADDWNAPAIAATSTFVIDYNSPAPAWQQVADMAFPRAFHNHTLLPDGTVLTTSGSQHSDKTIPVLEAELWSPATKTWRTLSPQSIGRTYHSNALLLPDATLLVSGSGRLAGMVDQRNYEIFSPPYLFKGARPVIGSAPGLVNYTSSFFVGTPDAASVTSAVLVKNGSFTHEINMEQRRVPLTFTQAAGGLDVVAPANANLAPPGYYMLFLLNSSGVPSVAKFVRLPAPYEDFIAPTPPASLSALGGIGTASLSWIAATDSNGVAQYNVHRSTTSGFAPTAANRIGQVTGTTFTDSGLTAGLYYYVVTAQDANVNVSQPSNESAASVVADVAPPSVSITDPGSLLSGTVALSALAQDDIGVAGVQFLLDGAVLMAEDITAPYSIQWNTSSTTNGQHQLTARARDTGGNQATSQPIAVTISNSGPSGAVALYGFEEAAGLNVDDSSGNLNTGSIAGATRVAGKYGSGLSFNGTSNMVSIPDSASQHLTNGLTAMAWVKPTVINTWKTVVMKESPGNEAWVIYGGSVDAGRAKAGAISTGPFYVIGNPTALPLNAWSHIAITLNGSTFKMFVDGAEVASAPVANPLAPATGPLRIGGNSMWGEFFSGIIDEVRVYNRALSVSEIQQAMNAPVLP